MTLVSLRRELSLQILPSVALLLVLLLLLPSCGGEKTPPQSDVSSPAPSETAVDAASPEDDSSSDAPPVDPFEGIDLPDLDTVLNPGEETYGAQESDGIFRYRLVNDSFYEIIGMDRKTAGRVQVPSVYKEKPVLRVCETTEFGQATFSSGLLSAVNFEEGVVSIGSSAFDDIDNLQKITFPASLVRLAPGAISTALSLTSVEVAEGSKSFRSINGVLFTLDENGELDALRFYPSMRQEEEYRVPEGVKTIDPDWVGPNPQLRRMKRLILPTTITSLAPGSIKASGMSMYGNNPQITKSSFASPFLDVYIPSGVAGLQEGSICSYAGIPLFIHCEDTEKPASWADGWCNEFCTVSWGEKMPG